MPNTRPSQFSGNIVSATSGPTQSFSFEAQYVQVSNRSAVTICVDFLSTSASASASYRLESSGSLTHTVPCSHVSLLSTAEAAITTLALGG
jgi:hypothetical protein